MAEPVNLRTMRKRKARTEAQAKAAEKRFAFGRSKIQRLEDKLQAEQARKILDGAKRERGE